MHLSPPRWRLGLNSFVRQFCDTDQGTFQHMFVTDYPYSSPCLPTWNILFPGVLDVCSNNFVLAIFFIWVDPIHYPQPWLHKATNHLNRLRVLPPGCRAGRLTQLVVELALFVPIGVAFVDMETFKMCLLKQLSMDSRIFQFTGWNWAKFKGLALMFSLILQCKVSIWQRSGTFCQTCWIFCAQA